MNNTDIYNTYLLIYIAVVLLFALVIFAIINLLFWMLRSKNLFYEKRVWILTNLIGGAILLAMLIPTTVDVCQSSYCIISDVVNIESDVQANKSSKYILITDGNGKVYTCYDYVFDTELLNNIDYPETAIYAKHSKLLLDYFPDETDIAEKVSQK